MKFCRDCKHYHPPQYTPWFTSGEACSGGEPQFNLVSGVRLVRRPDLERAPNALGERCGVDGKWFEPKSES